MRLRSLNVWCVVSVASLLFACGESAEPSQAEDLKSVEDFSIGEVSNGKGDAAKSLLTATQLKRLEGSLLDVISKLDAQIVVLEGEISVSEHESSRKYEQIVQIERDMASREQELRNQANNNLILCAFFYNPALCSVVVLIDNDQKMRDFKYSLEKAQGERSLIERKMANYKTQKASLNEQIEVIRQTKARLIDAYKNPGANVTYAGESSKMNTARYKIDVLKSVRSLTQEEIIKLQAIKTLAQGLGESIDRTLLVVGQLADNVDKILEQSQALFMDLLIDVIFPGARPSTIEKMMDAQIKAAVNELLEDYDWPLAELLRHAMGFTGESSDKLYQDVLDYYAALRFEYTERPEVPVLDHQTTTSSIEVKESLTPTELVVRVSVTHDARGDLIVALRHEESGQVFPLHTLEGGSKNHIRKAFTIDASKVEDTAGTWTLSVEDTLADDEGKLVYWTLSALQSVAE